MQKHTKMRSMFPADCWKWQGLRFPLLYSICYKPFLPPLLWSSLPAFIYCFFFLCIDSDLKGIQLYSHLHTLGHNFTTQSKFRILRQIAHVCRLLLHLSTHKYLHAYMHVYNVYMYIVYKGAIILFVLLK